MAIARSIVNVSSNPFFIFYLFLFVSVTKLRKTNETTGKKMVVFDELAEIKDELKWCGNNSHPFSCRFRCFLLSLHGKGMRLS